MPLTTIQDIFASPWGIVECCRQEIEGSGAGGFDRIIRRETDRSFPSARLAAGMMGCCESTARRWLREHDARYIVQAGMNRYYIEDVARIGELRLGSKKTPRDE